MSELNTRKPTYMRYSRVETILEQEPALKDRLGQKTEIVLKPDGEKQLFSLFVIQVTQNIHNSGKDAFKVKKDDVLHAACVVKKNGGSTPVQNLAVAVAERKPQRSKSLIKAVAAAKPAQITVPRPKPAAPKEKAVAVVTPPPPPAKPVEAVAVVPETAAEIRDKEAVLEQARTVLTQNQPGNLTAASAYISMYSLCLTAMQLCDLFGNHPEKEKHLKTLNQLVLDFKKFTAVKGAKET
jgi:hypothetical protein